MNVRSNAICPGDVSPGVQATPAGFADHAEDPANWTLPPAGRFGEASDVAALVAWLASEDAAHMNGAHDPHRRRHGRRDRRGRVGARSVRRRRRGDPARLVIAGLAAVVAGAVNAIAGGGTLLTFPTLIALGVNPVMANATNTVALFPGSLAGAIGFRRELGRTAHWLRMLLPPSLLGGAAGAVLLLHTPPSLFRAISPFLVLLAAGTARAPGPLRRAHRPRLRDAVDRGGGSGPWASSSWSACTGASSAPASAS